MFREFFCTWAVIDLITPSLIRLLDLGCQSSAVIVKCKIIFYNTFLYVSNCSNAALLQNIGTMKVKQKLNIPVKKKDREIQVNVFSRVLSSTLSP